MSATTGIWGWIISTTFITILMTIYLFLNRKLNYWKKRGIFFIPGSFPFGSVGKLTTFRTSVSEMFREFYDRANGRKYVGFYIMFKRSMLIRDPELIKDILVKDFSTFVDRGVFFDLETDPLSGHLFSVEGEYWRSLRNKLSPTFTSGKMKIMYNTVKELAENLKHYAIKKASVDSTVEMKDLTGRFGLEVISDVALGLMGNNFESESSAMKHMAEMMVKPSIGQYIRLISFLVCRDFLKLFRMRVTPKPVEDFFIKMIRKNVEYRETHQAVRKDFMQLLIDLRNNRDEDRHITNGNSKGGQKLNLTIEEIAAQSFVFVLAGFETSSVTLGFLLYELASHPDIQQKLFQELEAASGDLSYDVLHQLPYLEMVFCETLRKHPAVPILQRQSNKDYKLPDGKILPANTMVVISVFGLHRDPELFPDPDKFLPERFSKENQHKIVPYSYLPFGEGPRNCIGMRFGKMQIKLAVASILLHFRIEKSSKLVEPIPIDRRSFSYNAKGGMWLRLVEREKM